MDPRFEELTAALVPYWYSVSRLAQGRARVEQALRGAGLAPKLRARLYWGLSALAAEQGDFAAAVEAGKRDVELREGLGDGVWLPHALLVLANGYQGAERYADALHTYDRARRAAETVDDLDAAFFALHNAGGVALSQGNWARAIENAEQAIALKTHSTDDWLTLGAEATIAVALLLQGHPERARPAFERYLRFAIERESPQDLVGPLEGLAAAAAALREPCRAARLLGCAHAVRTKHNLPTWRVAWEALLMERTTELIDDAIPREVREHLELECANLTVEAMASLALNGG
jgi:tetratricopeptide (TPR) repeat protein